MTLVNKGLECPLEKQLRSNDGLNIRRYDAKANRYGVLLKKLISHIMHVEMQKQGKHHETMWLHKKYLVH